MAYNKLAKAAFIKFIIKTSTPLLIGKGESENTDIDLMVDKNGRPYIPGTSIAGAFRNHLQNVLTNKDSEINLLFGNEKQSLLYINNGILKSKEFNIRRRDGIEINEFIKTAKNTSKYDYEVLESGAEFEFSLELLLRNNDLDKYDDIKNIISVLISEIKNEKVKLGAKTRRGLGSFYIKGDVYSYLLDLEKSEELEEFINFSWDRMNNKIYLNKGKTLIGNNFVINNSIKRLEVELKVKNTLCIRDYLTLSILNENSTDEIKI